MNRTTLACLSPAAVLAGMLLVHCSSSTTSTSSGGDASTGHSTGAATSSAATSGASSGSSGAASTAHTGGTTASSVKNSGTVTGSTSETSSASSASGKLSDTHDAGPCVGPDGGAACDPGNVECNNQQCAVPGHVCCNGSNNSQVCQGVTATCGSPQTCDEKSDCPDGQICCLAATSITAFSITCQTGPTCPSSLGSAQICKTNAECPNGTCTIYDCGSSGTTEACTNPSTFTCTAK